MRWPSVAACAAFSLGCRAVLGLDPLPGLEPEAGSATDGSADGPAEAMADASRDTSESSMGTMPGCPDSLPTAGATCPAVGLTCVYDGDAGACNPQVVCASNGWSDIVGTDCVSDAGPGCSPTAPVGPCTVAGQECAYEGVTCTCMNGPPTIVADFAWQCLQPGCPSAVPTVDACAPPGLVCNYAWCAGGQELSCIDGTWQHIHPACP